MEQIKVIPLTSRTGRNYQLITEAWKEVSQNIKSEFLIGIVRNISGDGEYCYEICDDKDNKILELLQKYPSLKSQSYLVESENKYTSYPICEEFGSGFMHVMERRVAESNKFELFRTPVLIVNTTWKKFNLHNVQRGGSILEVLNSSIKDKRIKFENMENSVLHICITPTGVAERFSLSIEYIDENEISDIVGENKYDVVRMGSVNYDSALKVLNASVRTRLASDNRNIQDIGCMHFFEQDDVFGSMMSLYIPKEV